MRPILILLILLAVCASCNQIPNPEPRIPFNNSPVKTVKTKANAPSTASKTIVNASADAIVSCTRVEGKVAVVYGNGQKQSFKDNCPGGEDQPAFSVFRQEYYCDGLEVKSKLLTCPDNQTCYKGVCS